MTVIPEIVSAVEAHKGVAATLVAWVVRELVTIRTFIRNSYPFVSTNGGWKGLTKAYFFGLPAFKFPAIQLTQPTKTTTE